MINIKNVFSGKIEKKQDDFVFLCKYREIDNTLSDFNKNTLIDKSTKLNQTETSHSDVSNLCINSMFSNMKIDNNQTLCNYQNDQNDQNDCVPISEKIVFRENECRSKGFGYDSNSTTYQNTNLNIHNFNRYTNYATKYKQYKQKNKFYKKPTRRIKKRFRTNPKTNNRINFKANNMIIPTSISEKRFTKLVRRKDIRYNILKLFRLSKRFRPIKDFKSRNRILIGRN